MSESRVSSIRFQPFDGYAIHVSEGVALFRSIPLAHFEKINGKHLSVYRSSEASAPQNPKRFPRTLALTEYMNAAVARVIMQSAIVVVE